MEKRRLGYYRILEDHQESKDPPKTLSILTDMQKEQVDNTLEVLHETRAALHWAVRRACKQLQHTHKKIGEYPDTKFENVDPPYQHIRVLIGIIKDGLDVLENSYDFEHIAK